ncbi:hypothetical protein D187_009996 [Cystobacter fuscus DSM 2262]|uniref:Uncharacterized protein n=1 Tax=Cystobacter fuscus (strain ATCC 25194 / DSM 2262 / NBRC 100088 / M29) TaxID=1242864 RepID=S9PI80_CYSF2|nr:hypothetical protein D187_009996 [Cystobacter fuscus DSM 2262]
MLGGWHHDDFLPTPRAATAAPGASPPAAQFPSHGRGTSTSG